MRVTQRIVSVRELVADYADDGDDGVVGTTVDYLFRMTIPGESAESAFQISMAGAHAGGFDKIAKTLLSRITSSHDPASVAAATKLVRFDAILRA